MNFYNDLNILIIYGGRNDNMSNPIMSDVSVLNLFNMSWSKVSMSGIENVFKCSQSSCLFGNFLFIKSNILIKRTFATIKLF